MAVPSDILLGRIAIERGWVTRDQLSTCLREQASVSTSEAPPLGDILLRNGYLSSPQVDDLLTEQKRRLSDVFELDDAEMEDALLGRLLIKQGLVTERQIYECLRLQAERTDEKKSLGDILVEKNYLASDLIETAQIMQKRAVLVCPSCSAHYSTLGSETARKYTCKKCGCVLDRQELFFRPGETTGAVRIDLPEDTAVFANDPDHLLDGGKYVLVKEVGRGGSGRVWKAWQTDVRRYVAIKILAGALWGESDLRRFYREAELAAQLSHSNIASIYEVGRDGETHFIAMEFIQGESLAQLLSSSGSGVRSQTRRRTAGGVRRWVEIVRDVALAVDYAHSKGIIHRDLKPGNIMVSREGRRAYVMDFGLAKPVRSGENVTHSDAIVGTPAYMSPEQARGDIVSPRSDLFSLGGVLYTALTGRPPFRGQSPGEILMRVIGHDPPPPHTLNPRVHADLETICLKALEKNRRARYDSACSFAEDLTLWLDGEPIHASSPGMAARLWKRIRRRPLLFPAGGLITAALLVVAVLVVGGGGDGNALMREANRLYARGEHAAALVSYEEVLAREPGNETALFRKRLCEETLRNRGRESRANRARLVEFADLLFDLEEFEAAGRYYGQLASGDPEDLHVRRRRERCAEALLPEEEDDPELEPVVDRDRASVLYEAARSSMDAAVRMQRAPDFPVADILSRYHEARDSLRRALREDPRYSEARFLLGLLHLRLAEFREATSIFEATLEGNPAFASAAFHAALSQTILAELDRRVPWLTGEEGVREARARQVLYAERLLELSPTLFERWCAHALLHLGRGNPQKALDAIDKIYLEGSGHYTMHLLRAFIHMENRDASGAREELDTCVRLEPVAFEARYLRAFLMMESGEGVVAKEELGKALDSSPGEYRVYLLLARLADDDGDLPRTIRHLERARELKPDRAEEIEAVLQRIRE